LKDLYQQGDRTLEQYRQEKARLEQEMAVLLVPPDLDAEQVQALLADLPTTQATRQHPLQKEKALR
jgi:hypothetical protein